MNIGLMQQVALLQALGLSMNRSRRWESRRALAREQNALLHEALLSLNNVFRVSAGGAPTAATRDPSRNDVATDRSQDTEDDTGEDETAQDFLKRLNAYRRSQGLPLVKLDPRLCQGCREHNREMAGKDGIDHDGFERRAQHYGAMGENVAGGQSSAEEVLEDWKNSPGHNRQLLNADATRVGIAFDPKTRKWTFLTG